MMLFSRQRMYTSDRGLEVGRGDTRIYDMYLLLSTGNPSDCRWHCEMSVLRDEFVTQTETRVEPRHDGKSLGPGLI